MQEIKIAMNYTNLTQDFIQLKTHNFSHRKFKTYVVGFFCAPQNSWNHKVKKKLKHKPQFSFFFNGEK